MATPATQRPAPKPRPNFQYGRYPQFGQMQFSGQPQYGGQFPQYQGFNKQGQQQGPTPMAPGSALSKNLLNQGGFLGKAGNVKYDPFSGQEIAGGQRVKPRQFINRHFNEQSRGLLQGPAIQEAQNFQFDVPDSGVQGVLPQLGGAATNLLGQAGQAGQAGAQLTGQGAQALLGNIASTGGAAQGAGQDRASALANLQNLQQRALSPNVDPVQRQFFQQMADQERAAINARFAEGGDVAQQFERQNASDVANLAARGVLDSTTASNVIGRRQADLGALQANLLGQADQAANQRLLDERTRLTQAATGFGGIQGGQATGAGSLLAGLYGTQGQSASQLGGLGTTQQGIGAQLAGLGLQGLNQAGQLGLADQAQQADLQQAALSTRMLGNQLGLQNIQSYLNQQLGRQATRQGMDYQRALMEQAMNQQGGFFDNPFVNALSPVTNFF